MKLYKYLSSAFLIGYLCLIFMLQQKLPYLKAENTKSETMLYQSSANKNYPGKITYLEKIMEITDEFCEEKYNYFVNISSLCVDSDNNLYVADSGVHKIYKFNNRGKYISSFGAQGQGPGEFLGTLRISYGNNGKLYITDDGNWRLSVFSIKGDFVQQFPLEIFLIDVATVNSESEIFLLSQIGIRIIDLFDSHMRLKTSLLEMDYYLNFPYREPPQRILRKMMIRPSIQNVMKLLTKNDELFIIFNNTQIIVHLDERQKIINKFRIGQPLFIKDYRHRINEAIAKNGWINAFGSAFFDEKENLCLCYYNASFRHPEIYRYRKNGVFVDILRARNINFPTNYLISVCDSHGNYYSIENNSSKIQIFNIVN